MKFLKTSAAILTAAAVVVGMGSVAQAAPKATGTISYGLWDANQKPGYVKCAAAFKKASGVTVNIEQIGWDDYWTKVNAGFVSGKGYDVFTSHLAFFPEFAAKKQILPLDSYIKRDKVVVDATYQPGLAALWRDPSKVQYGLPKDFDTIGLFYNKKLADAAGVNLSNLNWNPTNGGTYEKAIAKLTVDKNGKRGDEAGFDPKNVATYGLWLSGSGGGDGQTQWSFLAAANGWKVNDGPWNANYHYDSKKLSDTLKWWQGLIAKGYMPSLAQSKGISGQDQLAAGKAVILSEGSWNTGSIFGKKNATFTPALAATPVGPTGKRASMYNGLADNIYKGTKNPEAAWQWVKFMGSAACQNIIAGEATVFPAIPAATAKAVKTFNSKGINVDALYVHIKNKTTFLFPIANKKSQVDDIIVPVMDNIMGGKVANDQIDDQLAIANSKIKKLFG
jgi:multiple sugar transport system substrate-binding protein